MSYWELVQKHLEDLVIVSAKTDLDVRKNQIDEVHNLLFAPLVYYKSQGANKELPTFEHLDHVRCKLVEARQNLERERERRDLCRWTGKSSTSVNKFAEIFDRLIERESNRDSIDEIISIYSNITKNFDEEILKDVEDKLSTAKTLLKKASNVLVPLLKDEVDKMMSNLTKSQDKPV